MNEVERAILISVAIAVFAVVSIWLQDKFGVLDITEALIEIIWQLFKIFFKFVGLVILIFIIIFFL